MNASDIYTGTVDPDPGGDDGLVYTVLDDPGSVGPGTGIENFEPGVSVLPSGHGLSVPDSATSVTLAFGVRKRLGTTAAAQAKFIVRVDGTEIKSVTTSGATDSVEGLPTGTGRFLTVEPETVAGTPVVFSAVYV
ncbi:MAG: hypothetical protein AAGD10_10605 [Myxococcota bacterium]